MVLPRPGGHQHRIALPRLYSSHQSRPLGERHPQETNPLPLRVGSRLPHPEKRRVAAPKHDLLHRIKSLRRFTDNERVDPLEVQMALVSYTIACLGFPRLLGLAIDWT
jgi:hypothetical protein